MSERARHWSDCTLPSPVSPRRARAASPCCALCGENTPDTRSHAHGPRPRTSRGSLHYCRVACSDKNHYTRTVRSHIQHLTSYAPARTGHGRVCRGRIRGGIDRYRPLQTVTPHPQASYGSSHTRSPCHPMRPRGRAAHAPRSPVTHMLHTCA